MNILYVTFSALDNNAGHTHRLHESLGYIQSGNKIHVMCLNGQEGIKTIKKYKDVIFSRKKADFDNWILKNSQKLSQEILIYCEENRIDLVILMMEVWDLMRDLSSVLYKQIPFATVLHAVPFLSSPVEYSQDFYLDVEKELGREDLPIYKKEYIKKHYKEMEDVLGKINVIAANNTVSSYIGNYFPKLSCFKLPVFFFGDRTYKIKNKKYFKYDLVYMARMEQGKGVEFIEKILLSLYKKLNRKVNLLILGKIDDEFTKKEINRLVNLNNNNYKVKYKGLVLNQKCKNKLLSKSCVFIYPSFLDTYAIVINEAISIGLPVIVWDVPFYRKNYREMEFVSSASLGEVEYFTDKIVSSMDIRHFQVDRIKKFLDKLPSSEDVFKKENDLYADILKDEKNH